MIENRCAQREVYCGGGCRSIIFILTHPHTLSYVFANIHEGVVFAVRPIVLRHLLRVKRAMGRLG